MALASFNAMKKSRDNRAGWVSVHKAAKELGVSVPTVRSWISKGRLEGKVAPVVRKHMLINPASFENAFKVECRWCKKVFTAKHPEIAEYCCRSHQILGTQKKRRRQK